MMHLHGVFCWALIFVVRLRFPSASSNVLVLISRYEKFGNIDGNLLFPQQYFPPYQVFQLAPVTSLIREFMQTPWLCRQQRIFAIAFFNQKKRIV